MNNPERQKTNPGAEILRGSGEAAGERSRELAAKSPEVEHKPEHSAEAARRDIEGLTRKEEASKVPEKPKDTSTPTTLSKKSRALVYKKTMRQAQSQMNPVSRSFSKLIHNPVIEKTSDVVSGTLARPNAIIAGAACALILVLAVYLLAKNMGYTLSGFETIGAFVLGWVIGLSYDFLRVMITGKN